MPVWLAGRRPAPSRFRRPRRRRSAGAAARRCRPPGLLRRELAPGLLRAAPWHTRRSSPTPGRSTAWGPGDVRPRGGGLERPHHVPERGPRRGGRGGPGRGPRLSGLRLLTRAGRSPPARSCFVPPLPPVPLRSVPAVPSVDPPGPPARPPTPCPAFSRPPVALPGAARSPTAWAWPPSAVEGTRRVTVTRRVPLGSKVPAPGPFSRWSPGGTVWGSKVPAPTLLQMVTRRDHLGSKVPAPDPSPDGPRRDHSGAVSGTSRGPRIRWVPGRARALVLGRGLGSPARPGLPAGKNRPERPRIGGSLTIQPVGGPGAPEH